MILSTYKKWLSYIIILVMVIGISVLALIVISHPIKDTSLSEEEHYKLSVAKNIICAIDKDTCILVNSEKIVLRSIRHFPFLKTVLPTARKHFPLLENAFEEGETYKINGEDVIFLSDYVFNEISGLTIILYHELQHVRFSDYYLYEKDSKLYYAKCLDHNHVKKRTHIFAEKMHRWLLTSEGSTITVGKDPRYYATTKGNTAENCIQ